VDTISGNLYCIIFEKSDATTDAIKATKKNFGVKIKSFNR